jgi:hypothetical protein
MSTLSESDMYQAAEHLARTEKGRGALEGFFGSWTGSALDAVRSSISGNE